MLRPSSRAFSGILNIYTRHFSINAYKKTTLETYVRKKGYGCVSGGNEEAPAESCAPHESTARNTTSRLNESNPKF
jgi:hypothetical protein